MKTCNLRIFDFLFLVDASRIHKTFWLSVSPICDNLVVGRPTFEKEKGNKIKTTNIKTKIIIIITRLLMMVTRIKVGNGIFLQRSKKRSHQKEALCIKKQQTKKRKILKKYWKKKVEKKRSPERSLRRRRHFNPTWKLCRLPRMQKPAPTFCNLNKYIWLVAQIYFDPSQKF